MGADPDERWKDWVERTLESHDKRLDGSEGANKYLMGAAAIIIWCVGFFSDKLKHLLGL